MDITKLGDYFEARRYLNEGVEWAEKMLEEGFFHWRKDDVMPSGLPATFIGRKGAKWDDVKKLKDLIDFSVVLHRFSKECHRYVKGHVPNMVDNAVGGTVCSVCLGKRYEELDDRGSSLARICKDTELYYLGGPDWTINPSPDPEGETLYRLNYKD